MLSVVLTHLSECISICYPHGPQTAEVVLTHLSECISIHNYLKIAEERLYLPIFQNVYPS
ncbi:hypothetical protein [Segatella copri]|uniref:hypothetical protein n=1 Tax=Segatella copri TaxID=165179 RepID=UPI003F59BED2